MPASRDAGTDIRFLRMGATTAFAFTLAMLAIGRLLRAWAVVPEQAPAALNQVVLYVCLPASVLLYAPKLAIDASVLKLALIPWLVLAASVVLALAASKRLQLSRGATAVLLLALPLGNTAFLGYPLTAALLGDAAVSYAVIYDQFGSFLIISTFGLAVIATYSGAGRPTLRDVAWRILKFPPFIALAVALTVMPADPPDGVASALKRLTDALLPLVTLATGMQLQLRLPREHRAPLAFGLVAKLAVLPAIAWGLTALLGLKPEAAHVAVLEAAMPTMITAMALAASAGLAPPLAAALVGYGIPLSVATLPLWRWLVAG